MNDIISQATQKKSCLFVKICAARCYDQKASTFLSSYIILLACYCSVPSFIEKILLLGNSLLMSLKSHCSFDKYILLLLLSLSLYQVTLLLSLFISDLGHKKKQKVFSNHKQETYRN